MQNFSYTVLDLLDQASRNIKTSPLNLGGAGGAGGGIGGPPGGFIGQLPQYRVAYDTLEIASSGTLPSGLTGISGWSLVDNLNHIRYRLDVLESGGSIAVIDDNTVTTYGDVTHLHFSGVGVDINNLGGGHVQAVIVATGSGGGGLDEPTADTLYLRLDTTNDPLTGQLNIDTTTTPGDGGIFTLTEGDSYTADFEQLNSTQNFASSPVIFGYREIQGNRTSLSYLLRLMEASYDTSTFSGGAILFTHNGTDRFFVNPNTTAAGVCTLIDTVATLTTGKILQIKNSGTEKFSIIGDGTVNMADGANIVLGTSTGTKIGTSTTQKLGFFNKAPVVQPAAYSPSNVTTDRTFDANSTTVDELADILGTLISDLQSLGLIG